MANMHVQVNKEDFLSKPTEEQNYLMYSAIVNLDARVSELERKSWIKSASAFIGGIIGGMLAYIGIKKF